MKQVQYDDLSQRVQLTLVKLQNDVEELQFEAKFYRVAAVIAFVIVIERLWDRFF